MICGNAASTVLATPIKSTSDHAVEDLCRHRPKRRGRGSNPGVGHDDVEAADRSTVVATACCNAPRSVTSTARPIAHAVELRCAGLRHLGLEVDDHH